MANLYRLIGAFVVVMASTLAHAAFPPTTGQAWFANYNGNHYRGITAPAACGVAGNAHNDPFTGMDGPYCRYQRAGRGVVELREEQICPVNSVLTGGSCVCEAGFDEQGGQCVAPPDTQCEGGRERDASGQCVCKAGTKEPPGGIGACLPNVDICANDFPMAAFGIGDGMGSLRGEKTISGVIPSGAVCWPYGAAGQGCEVTFSRSSLTRNDDGSFSSTGVMSLAPVGQKPSAACAVDTSDPGTTVSEKCEQKGSITANGKTQTICADEPKCPGGYSGTLNGVEVCATNQTPTITGDHDATEKHPDGSTTDTRTSTTCEGSKCTTTVTTINRDVSGNVTGSGTTVTTQDKGKFCEKNPSAPQCKTPGSGGSGGKGSGDGDDKDKGKFGGSCGAWTCEGDAVMCAIAKEQHKRACELYDAKDSPEYKAYGEKKSLTGKVTGDLEGNREIDIGSIVSTADQFLGSGGSCPPDTQISVGRFGSFAISWSLFCPWLALLGHVGVICSAIGAAFIVVGRGA